CLILAVGVIAALRSRFGALQLYVWFALFRPQEWLWFDISDYRLSTVLGALLVLPSVATGLLPVITHPISLASLGFLGTSLIAQTVPVKWVRWVTWFAVPCTIITIVSTFSRGGLLALSASILVFLALQKRRGLLLSCVAALLPLLLFVRLPEGYSERIATTVTY